jgi:hypothetical protein
MRITAVDRALSPRLVPRRHPRPFPTVVLALPRGPQKTMERRRAAVTEVVQVMRHPRFITRRRRLP